MKNYIFTITLLLALVNNTFGQDSVIKNYQWDTPRWEQGQIDEPKTILKKTEIIEYLFENDVFTEYYLYHQIEYLNSDEEIGNNNKKYLPYNEDSQMYMAKSRVIKKNGDVLELNEEKVLEAFDEETGEKFRYFALEGLEIGDNIELYYIVKRDPNLMGTFKYIQEKYPQKNYTFNLICPSHLEFEFLLKNDTSSIVKDTTFYGGNKYEYKFQFIDKLVSEEKAPYNSLRKRIIYKLDKNNYRGTENIVSYEEVSQNIYNNIYVNITKNELKSLQKFLKKIDLKNITEEAKQIRLVEDYVKSNINININADNRFNDISFAIENKVASRFGATKILANAYNQLGIKHDVILTTDRTVIPFDEDFESYHNLSRYLLYFTNSDVYLCPDVFEYRTGLIPAELTDNHGLFISEVSLGEFKSGIGQVKYIPLLPYKMSHHNHDIVATINSDLSNVNLSIQQSSFGYYSAYLQSILDLVGKDAYKEIGENVIHGIIENLDIISWEFENIGADKVNIEPLILKCEVSKNTLIENAGENYLFNVGELIGPQMELYSEDQRILPIHDEYKREFVRSLTILIPDGYKILNPDDLSVYAEYTTDGKQVLLFESNFTIEGQKIVISLNEFYDQIYFDLDNYQEYRKVVNSASDFNKVQLILGKI